MIVTDSTGIPPFRKRSRAKIWLRTGILAVFATLFGITLWQDVAAGTFNWVWGASSSWPRSRSASC